MQPARVDIQGAATTILSGLPIEEAAVLAWSLVCGSAIAERTQALSFHAGALQVRVPDAEWRSQLEVFSVTYLERLSKLLGDKIARIEFLIAGCQI
jgi:hypothetical protein